MVKKKVIGMVYEKRTQVQSTRRGEKKSSTLINSLRALNVFTHATGTMDASSQEPAYNGIGAGAKERFDLDIWKAKALLAARNQLFK